MSRLVKSFIGSFAARAGLSLTEFLGVLYVAAAAGPATLGTYVLFRAVFVVISMVLDLGVREATIKRIAEGDAQGEFLSASVLTKSTVLVPVVAAVVVFRGPLESYVGSRLILPFLLVLAVLEVFVESVYAGLHGEQRVGRAELSLFVNVAGKVILWVVLLTHGYGLLGLLIGAVAGSTLQLLVGLRLLSLRPRMPKRSHFERLFTFSRYSWLGTVRERAWIWTDTLFLGLFVTADLVGVYELSWRFSAAFFLVASSISSTLFANVDRLLRQKGEQTVHDAIEESLVYTGIAAIPGAIGGYLVGTSVLSAVGEAYAIGYPVLVVLIVARLVHCYEIVFAKVISALDRPDLVFRADATFVVLNVLGNLVAIAALGWIGAALATAVSMVARTLLSYRYLTRLIEVPIPRREIGFEIVAAVLMGAVLLAITGGQSMTAVETARAVGIGVAVYALVVLTTVDRVHGRVRALLVGLI